MASQPMEAEPQEAPLPVEPAEPSGEPTSPEQTQEAGAVQETSETQEPPSESIPSPFDLSDEDVKFAHDKFNGDVNALSRAWKETNNRAAEMARKLKESERPQETKPPQIDPARTEAPPQDGIPREIQDQAFAHVRQDRECQAWRGEYLRNNEMLGQHSQRAAQLDQDISYIQTRLNAERGKALGFEESLDEFQLRGLKDRLLEAKAEKRELVGEMGDLKQKNDRLADAYEQRLGQYRDHLYETSTAASRERQEREQVEQIATDLQTGWTKALEPTFKELGVPAEPKLRERLRKSAARAAIGHFQGKTNISDGEIQEFLVGAIKEEVEDRKVWTQHSMKTYSKDKKGDSKSAAPPAKASVAPADPLQSKDWREVLNERKRLAGIT